MTSQKTARNFKQRTLHPRFWLIVAIFAFSTQFVRPLVPQLGDWWFILLWIVLCIVSAFALGITVTRVVVPQTIVYDQKSAGLVNVVFFGLSLLLQELSTIIRTWIFALLWTIACLLLAFLLDRIPRLPNYWRDKGIPIMLIFVGTMGFAHSLLPWLQRWPFIFGWIALGAYVGTHVDLLLTHRQPRW